MKGRVQHKHMSFEKQQKRKKKKEKKGVNKGLFHMDEEKSWSYL